MMGTFISALPLLGPGVLALAFLLLLGLLELELEYAELRMSSSALLAAPRLISMQRRDGAATPLAVQLAHQRRDPRVGLGDALDARAPLPFCSILV